MPRPTIALFALIPFLAGAACTPVPRAPALGVQTPDSALVFVRGYREASDACQLVGETSFTNQFLDDAADLVGCPTGSAAAASLVDETGAPEVGATASFTLYSVPVR